MVGDIVWVGLNDGDMNGAAVGDNVGSTTACNRYCTPP